MRGPSKRISRAHFIVCPACELGELRTCGPEQSRCDSCGLVVGGAILESLQQIVTLPDAAHPRMRRLPDGMFHCPACGLEGLPGRLGGWTVRGVARPTRDRPDYYRVSQKFRLKDKRFPKAL